MGTTVVFRKGEKVPLSWITGYQVSEAHTPVTPEAGCDKRHLHASGEGGIVIQRPGQQPVGPLPAPDRNHCGYGHIVDLPY